MNWSLLIQYAPQLLQAILQGVAIIESKGVSTPQAVQEAIDHVTPGQPNAPALAPEAAK
jgi:hypothetical protein